MYVQHSGVLFIERRGQHLAYNGRISNLDLERRDHTVSISLVTTINNSNIECNSRSRSFDTFTLVYINLLSYLHYHIDCTL